MLGDVVAAEADPVDVPRFFDGVIVVLLIGVEEHPLILADGFLRDGGLKDAASPDRLDPLVDGEAEGALNRILVEVAAGADELKRQFVFDFRRSGQDELAVPAPLHRAGFSPRLLPRNEDHSRFLNILKVGTPVAARRYANIGENMRQLRHVLHEYTECPRYRAGLPRPGRCHLKKEKLTAIC
jgi:hypothetical protein